MVQIAFAAPILPGKLEAWRRFNQETLTTWAEGHDAANARAGVTVERTWLQQTPEGDFALIYIECEDPALLFGNLGANDDAYTRWFRGQVLELHGLDLAAPADGPISTLEFDWRTPVLA
jgi:hypothetical protein